MGQRLARGASLLGGTRGRVKCLDLTPVESIVHSEFGDMTVIWDGATGKVMRIFLPNQRFMSRTASFKPALLAAAPPGAVAELCRNMVRRLAGAPAAFNLDVLVWSRTTCFQERVLRMENRIPRGMVSSYGRIAAKLRAPGRARAVGNALGQNPFQVVIP